MEDRYLFKAKFDDSDRWAKGQLVEVNDTYLIIPNHAIKILSGWFSASNVVEVKKDTICQCTCLKDKNGNLIWENDIIHKPFYTDYDAYANSEAYTGRIQYADGGWSVEITKSDGSVCVSPIIEMIAYSEDIEDFEVVGNIFDNPELLEA